MLWLCKSLPLYDACAGQCGACRVVAAIQRVKPFGAGFRYTAGFAGRADWSLETATENPDAMIVFVGVLGAVAGGAILKRMLPEVEHA